MSSSIYRFVRTGAVAVGTAAFGAAASPIPISGLDLASMGTAAPGVVADARSVRVIDEMSDVTVVTIRTVSVSPQRHAGVFRGLGGLGFDPTDPFDPFRPDFVTHWGAEGASSQGRGLGRALEFRPYSGFGGFADAIFASHQRVRPALNTAPSYGFGTNSLNGWMVLGLEEFGDLFDQIAIAPRAQADTEIGFGSPEVVAIPLPGSAAIGVAGLLIVGSRRRR